MPLIQTNSNPNPRVAIIGGGPAGLMAAEEMSRGGDIAVDVYDAMPSMGRKFLMAGKGGLNLTHGEAVERFLDRYGERRTQIEPLLAALPPESLRAWARGLGVETFVGSSGRVFPAGKKAAPLLRAWLRRLREAGVRFHVRHRWQGWNEDNSLRFATPEGRLDVAADAVVLALGGGSWPQLGSDGAWAPLLAAKGVPVAPLRPANCGFDIAWSEHFREKFAGSPVKPVSLTFAGEARRGEFVVTAQGVEGGLVYGFSAALRDAIETRGEAVVTLDLMPDWSAERVREAVCHPRGARSLSSHLQSRLGLKGVKVGLIYECLGKAFAGDTARLAETLKALPLRLASPRPLAEAISSAGGVDFAALERGLMLRELPGVFCAGEMLDWEAPTGGYLLTACFAGGLVAGRACREWLAR